MTAPEDFVVFCTREHPRLVKAMDLYVGDLGVAEELAQEAMVRAGTNWPRVAQLESPGGWTYRVAVNLANSWFRRRSAERRALRRLGAPNESSVSGDPDAADAIVVREAVRSLPDGQRAAIVGRYFLDLPAAEVGARQGRSAEAVRTSTKRGLAELRARLAPEVTANQEASDVE